MQVLAQRFEGNADKMVRKAALAVDQTVVLATPVDTGRARSNWIVQLGAPAESVIEAYAPGFFGSTGAENAQAAIDQGSAEISGYRGGQGTEIHITNNLPYIGDLNDGWSAQAAANFVQTAIQTAAEAVTGTKLLD